MSPKRKVFLLSGIFALLGISISVIIIAIGGGFSSFGPSIIHPPTTADLWVVGQPIHQGTLLNYSLTRIGGHSSPWSSLGEHSSLINSLVSMNFVQDKDNKDNNNNWRAIIHITNGTVSSASSTHDTVLLSKQQLINAGPINQSFVPYYEPIESSILEIRDITLGDAKYLVIGAEWNSISVGLTTVPVKIVAQERIKTNAGTFNAFVLSYTIGSKTSRIWIAPNIPLPIKAEVYNAQNELQYSYELIGKKI
jgi:hypothetical protein